MPRRSVTASNDPPDMERTTTASGRYFPIPSMRNPLALWVANPHRCRRMGAAPKPRAEGAEAISRACQSMRSITRPTIGWDALPSVPKRSGEGRIEQVQVNISRLKAFAGFQRRDRDLCWTEQHRINSVEVAFDRFENFRKRAAIVTRCFA